MIHQSNIDLQRLARRLRRAAARCGCRSMTGTDAIDTAIRHQCWPRFFFAPRCTVGCTHRRCLHGLLSRRAVVMMQGTKPRRLDCPRCRTLLPRRRHSLEHVGDAVLLISTLQAPTLLVPRARVRLESSEGDVME